MINFSTIFRNQNKERIFKHDDALDYEFSFAKGFIDDDFIFHYRQVEKAKKSHDISFPGPKNNFFDNETKEWKKFANHCRNRVCMEIGPGPIGMLPKMYWVKNQIIIDPLIDKYRNYEIEKFGQTIFSSRYKLHSVNGEEYLPQYEKKVNGCIVARNCLDHVEDPWKVLENISKYAARGCYLLLWTDLWHLIGGDEGHNNISQSIPAFQATITGLGFNITHLLKSVRNDGSTIEFGCRAIKQFAGLPRRRLPSIVPHT